MPHRASIPAPAKRRLASTHLSTSVTAIASTSALGNLLGFPATSTVAAARTGVAVTSTPVFPPSSGTTLGCRQTIDAARRGDRKALASLLGELQDPWYRLSLSLLRDVDQAAEAVQETGLRFLKQVRGFRGESQIRTWSLGIAINVVREMKRRRARQLTGGDAVAEMAESARDGAPPAADLIESSERRDALRTVLGDLPDRQREALVLRFFEDLSVDETARAMGCASGTVKATVHQALRSLRKRLHAWT